MRPWGEENTKALSNVDPAKIGLSQAARKPLLESFMKRAADGKLLVMVAGTDAQFGVPTVLEDIKPIARDRWRAVRVREAMRPAESDHFVLTGTP